MEKTSLKNFFKTWNWYEIMLTILGIVLPIAFSIIFKSDIFECLLSALSIVVAVLFTKGVYWGYILAIINIVFYTIVEISVGLYGELFINWALYLPMYIFGLIEWIKHQDKERATIVVRKEMSKKEYILLLLSQIICLVPYYFILRALNTTSVEVSAISVAVSFVASYLSARRSLYCFVGYIINDIVLIVLWSLQVANGDLALFTVLLSPILLLMNDVYGVFNWYTLRKKQNSLDDFGKRIENKAEENSSV